MKIWDGNFFQIMLNEILEVLKMRSADIKTDVKQEIKRLVTVSKLVVGIPCSLILPIKNGMMAGGGEGIYT